jgi:hypothetical protein
VNRSLFRSMATQVIRRSQSTSRTSRLGLAKRSFVDGDRKVVAIEQNPATNSSWARLARQGHDVVQFKDVATGRYIGVAVDGEVTEY